MSATRLPSLAASSSAWARSDLQRPAGLAPHAIDIGARMQHREREFAAHRVGLEDAEIGDDPGRAAAAEAEPVARIAAGEKADRADEIEPIDQRPLAMAQ